MRLFNLVSSLLQKEKKELRCDSVHYSILFFLSFFYTRCIETIHLLIHQKSVSVIIKSNQRKCRDKKGYGCVYDCMNGG